MRRFEDYMTFNGFSTSFFFILEKSLEKNFREKVTSLTVIILDGPLTGGHERIQTDFRYPVNKVFAFKYAKLDGSSEDIPATPASALKRPQGRK